MTSHWFDGVQGLEHLRVPQSHPIIRGILVYPSVAQKNSPTDRPHQLYELPYLPPQPQTQRSQTHHHPKKQHSPNSSPSIRRVTEYSPAVSHDGAPVLRWDKRGQTVQVIMKEHSMGRAKPKQKTSTLVQALLILKFGVLTSGTGRLQWKHSLHKRR